MKYLFFSLAAFSLAVSSIAAQDGKVVSFSSESLSVSPDSILYGPDAIDQPPRFSAERWEWPEYIGKIVRRASAATEDQHSTVVTVVFIVEKDGSLSNKRATRGRGPLLHVLLSAIDQSPCWIPAMKNGQPVRVWYSLRMHVCME